MISASSSAVSGPARWIGLLLIGAAGGFLSGLFGIGGGVIMIPLLMTALRVDQRRAAATSLAAILPAALVGSASYAVGGELAILPAALIAAGGIVGSVIGTRLLRRLPLAWLRWLFLALIVVVAARMLLVLPDRGGDLTVSVPIGIGLVLVGVLMGVASGLFGIGGGVIAVPLLIALFGAGDLLARGTSLAAMVVTALSGTIANRRARLMDLREAAVMGVAGMAASAGGVAVAFLLGPVASAVLFVLLMTVSAAQLVLSALRERRRRGGGTDDGGPASS